MIDVRHASWVQTNNIVGTFNILYAMRDVCPEAHLLKLGTMGEYGTPNVEIPVQRVAGELGLGTEIHRIENPRVEWRITSISRITSGSSSSATSRPTTWRPSFGSCSRTCSGIGAGSRRSKRC